MARQSSIQDLARSIQKLRDERKACADRLAEIDATFASLGIDAGATARGKVSAVAVAAPARRGRRGRRSVYGQSSEEFILSLLQGGKTMSTAEINAAWKQAGRGSTADMTLMRMVKLGRLKRRKIRGGRGSNYSVG